MATTVYTNNQYYTDIAEAIRNKNGSSTQYKPSEMAPAINALIVSGSAPRLQAKSINPTTSSQVVKYDSGYNGLSQVTVGAIQTETKTVTTNGDVIPTSGKYLTKVIVNVPVGSTINNQNKTVTPTTSQQSISADSGYTGLGVVTVNAVQTETKSVAPSASPQTITPTNGKYLTSVSISAIPTETTTATPTKSTQNITPSTGKYLTKVTVNPIPSQYIIPNGSQTVTANNTYDVTSLAEMVVNVPTGSTINNQPSKEVTPSDSQQIITPDTGYTGLDQVIVKPIPSNYIIPSGNKSITSNGSNIDVKEYATVSVAVPAPTPNLQSKTVSPSTSSQTVTADSGYDGLSSVQVNAMTTMSLPTTLATSATSGYTRVTTVDRSTSTRYINIPAGYHSRNEYYQISAVANGSATNSGSASGSSATISTGTNTITLQKAVSITPTVTAGYISSGTAGNVTVSLTASVATKAAATITPGTSNQTIASGTYLTGTQTIAGDADLVAANIKSGVNIFNVAGTFTSDATAAAADIVSGETAYVNGSKVTGSLVINKYHTGSSAPSSSLGSNGDIYIQQ